MFQHSTQAVLLERVVTYSLFIYLFYIFIISSSGNRFVGACVCGACVFINIPEREKNKLVSNILYG